MTTNDSVTHGSTVASFQLTTRCLGFCNHFFPSEVSVTIRYEINFIFVPEASVTDSQAAAVGIRADQHPR